MIIVPRTSLMSFLLGKLYSHHSLDCLVGRLRETIQSDDATQLRSMLLQLCLSCLSRNYESDEARSLYLGNVAVNAAFLREETLFTNVVEQISGSLAKNHY